MLKTVGDNVQATTAPAFDAEEARIEARSRLYVAALGGSCRRRNGSSRLDRLDRSAISTLFRCWDLLRRLRNEAELRYGQAFRTRFRSSRRSLPRCSAGRLRPDSWRPPRSWESSGARTFDGRSYTASRVLTALASGSLLSRSMPRSAVALSVSPRQRLWPLCSRRLWIPRSLRSLAAFDTGSSSRTRSGRSSPSRSQRFLFTRPSWHSWHSPIYRFRRLPFRCSLSPLSLLSASSVSTKASGCLLKNLSR